MCITWKRCASLFHDQEKMQKGKEAIEEEKKWKEKEKEILIS